MRSEADVQAALTATSTTEKTMPASVTMRLRRSWKRFLGELRRHPHFLFRASPRKAPWRIGGVTCLLQHLVFLWQSAIRPRDGLSQCGVFLVLIQVE